MIFYNITKNILPFKLEREDARSKLLSLSSLSSNIVFPFSYIKGEEDYVSLKFTVKYKNIDGDFFLKEEMITNSISSQIVINESFINIAIVEKIQVEIYFNGSCESNKFGNLYIYYLCSR